MEPIEKRLAYLRGEIEAERISYGELAELQSLREHIEPGDTLLLEWASIPEFDNCQALDEPPLTVRDYLGLARSALIVANESFVRAVQGAGVTPLYKRWNADMSLAIDSVDVVLGALRAHQPGIDASVMELPPNEGTKRVMRRYSGRYDLYGTAAQRSMSLNFAIPYGKRIGKFEAPDEKHGKDIK